MHQVHPQLDDFLRHAGQHDMHSRGNDRDACALLGVAKRDDGNPRLAVEIPRKSDQQSLAVPTSSLAVHTSTRRGIGRSLPSHNVGQGTPQPPHPPNAHTLARPGAVWLDGDSLWVADTCNNRALLFKAY